MKKTLQILTLLTLSLNAYSQIPNYVPSNGLVGWWPFNGNANDESGNGNNGTVNGANFGLDRFNNLSSACNLDNQAGDNIAIPSINFGSDFTISIWFKLNDYNQFQASSFFSQYDGNIGIELNYTTNPNILLYSLIGPEADATKRMYSLFLVGLGNWNHLVWKKSGSFSEFLLNGISIYQQNNLSNITVNNGIAYFGKAQWGGNELYGLIDDIGIWSRALTECEIQDLYHTQLNSASMSISAGLDQSICAGDNVTLNGAGGSNYQWNNNVVDGQAFAPTQSNAYVVNGTDTLGCQGTDTVVITVLENATSSLTQTALDSYTLNGQTYTQSGTYIQTVPAANGCDSIITLNLSLNFTGIDELGTGAKKLVKITDLNGKIIPRRKNTLMLFIYEDGTVERVVEMEE